MPYCVSPKIQDTFDTLLADSRVQKAFAFIDADQEFKIAELKELVQLHGASFKEAEMRAPAFRAKLEQYGAADCRVDAHGNAFGFIVGGSGPLVVTEGHLDTVFDAETPLAVTERDGRIYCPGIGDDTAGLANILCLLRAIRHAGLLPEGTILIGGTAGEEGEGDNRGAKGLLDDHADIAAMISIEPGPAGGIIHGGVGSRRYEFVFSGPGGHSWAAYGLPSPIHALGRAIAKMAGVATPELPRTTYTVGVVSGGASVNAIASEARMKLDMRSTSPQALEDLEKKMLRHVDDAVSEENAFRVASGRDVAVEKRLIGDRPAGETAPEAPVVQAAWAAVAGAGASPSLTPPASTNANVPISRGVPAVVLRTGGETGGTHTPDEWFRPEGSQAGVKSSLLLLFALAGLQGVTEPVQL